MAITNEQLTEQLGLELGIDLKSRRPYANEIFKFYDIELLPIAAEDTLLGEIFEWRKRNWRTTANNLVGYIAPEDRKDFIKNQLANIPKVEANIPDFEFSKSEIFESGFKLPFLFNLNFTGKVEKAKELSVKINNVKRARLTNIDAPGIEIAKLLSIYSQKSSKGYRNKIKNDFISKSFFYAGSVEIELKKDAKIDIGIEFDVKAVNVEVGANTDTEKKYKITYKDNYLSPFGAHFRKGKDLF